MIIAVDFDGTLAVTEYPKIIKPVKKAINTIKLLKMAGFTIILYTCRHGKELDEAVEWCKKQGLVFDYVNENVPELIEKYGDCRKIYADFYIDDHNKTIEDMENAILSAAKKKLIGKRTEKAFLELKKTMITLKKIGGNK